MRELLEKILEVEDSTRDPEENLAMAIQKYLGMEIPDKVMLSDKPMRRYGVRASGGIVVDVEIVSKEHPAFIAGVIYHEYYHNVLAKKGIPSPDQESRVRYKTKMWAALEQLKHKEDPEALAAYKKIVLLSESMNEGWGKTLATTAAAGIIGGAAMLGGAHKVSSEKPVEKPVAARQVEQPAPNIDMQRIASIESSNDSKAENTRTGARGLTQIMQSTWEEVVDKMGEDWSWDDAFDADKNLAVGSYYMNVEIPRLLKHYKIEDTVENRLAAYNWGVGNLSKVGIEGAPQETIDYIRKYKSL